MRRRTGEPQADSPIDRRIRRRVGRRLCAAHRLARLGRLPAGGGHWVAFHGYQHCAARWLPCSSAALLEPTSSRRCSSPLPIAVGLLAGQIAAGPAHLVVLPAFLFQARRDAGAAPAARRMESCLSSALVPLFVITGVWTALLAWWRPEIVSATCASSRISCSEEPVLALLVDQASARRCRKSCCSAASCSPALPSRGWG